jgi:hypothetical protein
VENQTDLDIRYGFAQGIRQIGIGLSLFALGLALLLIRRLSLGLFLLGVGFVIYGVVNLLDRVVKLSFTAEGLKDHGTGTFIRWTDCRGVRLRTQYWPPDYLGPAVLFIRVPGHNGEREVPVKVARLEREPAEIAQLVQKWAKEARQRLDAWEQPPTPNLTGHGGPPFDDCGRAAPL